MTNSTKFLTSCHCKAVTIVIDRKPEFINDCNCSLCINTGAIWGYYKTNEVTISGLTQKYQRSDRKEPTVQSHFCVNCGATTHWTLTDSFLTQNVDANNMGVNMRLFDDNILKNIELRYPDGKGWDGKIPYTYRKNAIIL